MLTLYVYGFESWYWSRTRISRLSRPIEIEIKISWSVEINFWNLSRLSLLSRKDYFLSRSRFLKLRLFDEDFDASRFLSRPPGLNIVIWILSKLKKYFFVLIVKINYLKVTRFSRLLRLSFWKCQDQDSESMLVIVNRAII